MIIHSSYPAYKEFSPLVPVWCITHDVPGCTHRFFDSCDISPSGRYLAAFQMPFENRQPNEGEYGNIRIYDLITGENKVIAQSCAWESQLGANINWGATDEELYYNDINTHTWQQYAIKINPISGKKEKLKGTVYHASSDGKWLVSSDLSKMRKTQNGYGLVLPKDKVKRSCGIRDDEGFYLTNTINGNCELFISIKEIVEKAFDKKIQKEMADCEVYGFHSKFNNQGTRLMLSLRWYPIKPENSYNIIVNEYKDIRFAWITVSLDKKEVFCAIGPEQFKKGGHHATWCPDGEHISLNLRMNGKDMRFVRVRYDGKKMNEIVKNVKGSGHPTIHPSGHILTDTYLQKWDYEQYGDGTVPLRWINIKTGKQSVPIRINVKQPFSDEALRVDPHPAWDRTWRYIVFNGYMDGGRRVFIADMENMYSENNINKKNMSKDNKIYINIKRYIKGIL